MIDQLLQEIRKIGADAWEITESQVEGWEFYLIRHRLDQNRARLVTHTQVKLYAKSDDGAFLGSASGEIAPTATPEEMQKILSELLQSARLIKNPAYTLNPKPSTLPEATPNTHTAMDVMRDYLDVMHALPETSDADINSYEIFASLVKTRLITSEGIDYTTVAPQSMLEVVVNARDTSHEIELYRLYHGGQCPQEMITEDLKRTLTFGLDRLHAEPTPQLSPMDVLFSTDAACEIYSYFIQRMDASLVKRGYSNWTIGQAVAEGITGDRVTLEAKAVLPYSSRGGLLDAEGAVASDMPLIIDGVAKHYHGSRQFREYLGMKDGYWADNFEVTGGSMTDEEIRSGNYLEIVEFSDFQVNAITGDIAGEIRLGYLHLGGQVRIVTGGSISGSMMDFIKTLRATRRQTQYDHLRIPACTRLHHVTITGCEEMP